MKKNEFFESINEMLNNEIYITEKLDEFLEETGMNQGTIIIDSETVKNIKSSEVCDFLKNVIKDRKNQLEKSNKNVNLLFYLWYDNLSGYLHFDFINSKHKNLPFQQKLVFVDSMIQIVEKFLDSDYLDYLNETPWEEIEKNKNNQEDILNIYKEIL